MDYEIIKHELLKVFIKCNIYYFPIDCFAVLTFYALKYTTYQEQSRKKQEKCFKISDDAFTAKKVVFYNMGMPKGRIRFSLMHELGHIVLKHGDAPSEMQEREADFFASHILAPRMAIHYAGCKNQNDVAKLFHISMEAAQYAFDDYRRWHRQTIYHKMTAFDKALYAHFYNDEAKCFVYSIKRCAYCDSPIYNMPQEILCDKCQMPSTAYMYQSQQSEDFRIAESQWLYKGL